MKYVLNGYEPAAVWKYFEEICSIPHGSGNTKQLSDYLVGFAKEHGFAYVQDDSNNVIIIKEATPGYEDKPAVIIQGHIDMVCEKTPECPLDLTKDGLDLFVDGEYLGARGTTLGGDDGIAIAIGMAIMTDGALVHPRIELVATVDEEVGLLGATALDPAPLKGKYLINIDSEEEGIFTAGCAGGMTFKSTTAYETEKVTGKAFTLVLEGLKGGHSGIDISRIRLNADLTMARVLGMLCAEYPLRIATLEGGSKDNVIPRRCVVTGCIDADEAMCASLAGKCDEIAATLRSEYACTDDGAVIDLTFGDAAEIDVLTEGAAQKLIDMLVNLPDGVQKMSGEIEGLVETSLNIGVCTLKDGSLFTMQSIRSSKASAKKWLAERVRRHFESFGASCVIEGDYPAWEFAQESPFRSMVCDTFETMFGYRPEVVVLHAGVECGLFTGKMPGLDCVSIGPEMHDVHTVEERLHIASTERTYALVRRVVEQLAE